MNHQKGFTLIELLAVIVILAVIALITTTTILKVIDKIRIESHKENENMLTRVTEIYLTNNTEYLPSGIGDTTEITLSELRNNGLISKIKSPNDSKKECDGYMLVTKLGQNEYDYTPYLNCSDNITNSVEDGLLAHYKFDDFQEPTENLLLNPRFDNTSNWQLATIGSGNFTVSNNWGKINIPDLESGNYYYLFQHLERITNPNTAVTFSVDFKNDVVGTFALRLVMFKNVVAVMQPLSRVDLDGTGGVKRVHVTTSYTDYTDRLRLDILAGSWYSSYGGLSDVSIEFSNAQLEEKSYPTPFVNGVREATIKDYSVNSNHAQLDFSKTPKWDKQAKIGNGAYEFDGKNVIEISNIDNLSQANGVDKPFSISMWVKANQRIGTYDGFINILGQNDSYEGIIVSFSGSDTRLRVRFWQDGGTNLSWDAPNFIDSWHQIVVTVANNRITIYQNGNLIRSDLFTNPFLFNGKVLLGLYSWSNNYYDGFIDDVKLYNRVLSEKEIKLDYEIKK
jgi:type IV pilus assembly protein PilA